MFIIKSLALLGGVFLLLKAVPGTAFVSTLWLTLLVVVLLAAFSTNCFWGCS
jgi:hypothetical protein